MTTRAIKGGPNGTWAGSTFIPAGEYRSFHEAELPHHLRTPVESVASIEAPLDPLVQLISLKVADIAEALPGLTDAQLDELQEMNEVGAARKGVSAAIAAEQEERVAARESAEVFLLADEAQVLADLADQAEEAKTPLAMAMLLQVEQENENRPAVVSRIVELQAEINQSQADAE